MTLPDETAAEAPQPDLAEADLASPSPTPGAPARRREPLYFVIVVLLIADIVFGLGLAVFAEEVLMFRPMAIMGCGLAALGLGVLAYFVLFGGGSDKRRG